MKDQHQKDCTCSMCQDLQKGLPYDEAVDKVHQWEQECMAKHGWYVHLVGDEKSLPMGINAHTHGFIESYGHLDFQIVLPLKQEMIHDILCYFEEKVKEGNVYKHGDKIEGVIGNWPVKLIDANDGDRPVLRIIFPDPNGQLDVDKLTPGMSLQYAMAE